MKLPRALLALVGLVAAVAAPGLLGASPAQAASYRYWSYWQGSEGTWQYSSQGAGTFRPKDGSVQGWRFAISEGASSSTIAPRGAPSFSSLCAGVPAVDGKRRVGLVIDHGTSGDAPKGEQPPSTGRYCVVVEDGKTGMAVLTAVASSVRTKNGLVCGINDYPRAECAAVIRSAPAASRKPTPQSSTRSQGSSSSSSGSNASTSNGGTSGSNGDESSTPTDAGGAAAGRPATSPGSTATDRAAADAPGPGTTPSPEATVIDASAVANTGSSPAPTIGALVLIVGLIVVAALARVRRRP